MAHRAGQVVHVSVHGVPVPAFVAATDSPLAREGFQLLFLLCGDACADALCLSSPFDDNSADGESQLPPLHAAFGLRLFEPPSLTASPDALDRTSRVH